MNNWGIILYNPVIFKKDFNFLSGPVGAAQKSLRTGKT